jgi:hypothetical protein
MPKRSSTHARPPGDASGLRRRVLIGFVVLALLTVAAGLLAYVTRDRRIAHQPTVQVSASATALATASAAPSPSSSASVPTGRGSVATPPKTTDPVVFGKAAAKALWSYDTRTLSQPQQLAGLKAWMTAERKYADWASVSTLIPTKALWSQLRGNGQYATATATATEGHIPSSFTTALNADPGALTTAYVYAVTVTGKQSIDWNDGGSGAESRSVTLGVQCRPSHSCALAGVLPAVAP